MGLFFHSFIRFFGFSFRTFLIAFTFTLVSTNLPSPLRSSSSHLIFLLCLYLLLFLFEFEIFVHSSLALFDLMAPSHSHCLLAGSCCLSLSLFLALPYSLSLFVICTAITGAYTDFRSYSALRASFVFGAIFPAIFPNWRLKANQLNPRLSPLPFPLLASLHLRLYWHTPRLI